MEERGAVVVDDDGFAIENDIDRGRRRDGVGAAQLIS
jgi:hypothetical protein